MASLEPIKTQLAFDLCAKIPKLLLKENKTPKVPVYAAGDARHGSTLVVNSLADGLLCAKEVAADLLRA